MLFCTKMIKNGKETKQLGVRNEKQRLQFFLTDISKFKSVCMNKHV